MSKHEQILEVIPKRVGFLDIRSAPNLEEIKNVPTRLNEVFKSVMQKGTDYAVIPGTPRPTLLKAGAELLAGWLGLATETTLIARKENTDYEHPFFSYTSETRVYTRDGGYIANGFGTANSKETRYAYRWVQEKDVPYELDRLKIPSKSSGGTKLYRIDTPASEVFTLQNTIVKMSKKRAFVDSILTATGAARIFSQDVGDEDEDSDKIASARPVKDSPVKEEVQSNDPMDLSKHVWYTTDDKGKTRKRQEGDQWSFANIAFGGKPIDLARSILEAIDKNNGALVIGNEVITFDEGKGQLLRRNQGETL